MSVYVGEAFIAGCVAGWVGTVAWGVHTLRRAGRAAAAQAIEAFLRDRP